MSGTWWKNPRVVGTAIVAFLFVVVLLQNTGIVTLRVLFWHVSLSQVILIPLVMAIGFGLGWVAAKWSGRHRSGPPGMA